MEVEGAFLKCMNLFCEARTSRSVLYWCRALELDGVGEKLVDQLLDAGYIRSCADLYRLSMDDLLKLERMGEKSATNVLREVDKARSMSLGKFLHALGLPGIGPELASAMASTLGMLKGCSHGWTMLILNLAMSGSVPNMMIRANPTPQPSPPSGARP